MDDATKASLHVLSAKLEDSRELILAKIGRRLGLLLRIEIISRCVHLVDNYDENSHICKPAPIQRGKIHVLAYSKTIFRLALSRTSSSMVSLLTNRYTLTWDF